MQQELTLKNFSNSIGYRNYYKIDSPKIIKKIIKKFINSKGPSLLEVKIKNGSLKNLSRPKNLIKIKEKIYDQLMSNISFSSVNELKVLLKEKKLQKILLICGENSFEASGASKILRDLLKKQGIKNI